MSKIITLIIALALPLFSHASSIPDFPMAFYGTVKVDGVSAPVNSIVRVYSGTEEVGVVALKETGIYGSNGSTEQKLIVKESAGELMFSIQSPSINSGVETKGLSVLTYAGFESGETIEKNLNFIVNVDSNVSANETKKSGGGGGGGGSSKKKSEVLKQPLPQPNLSFSTTSNETEQKIVLQKQLIVLLTQLISLLKLKMGGL